MKFQTKLRIIEAEQFWPDNKKWPPNVVKVLGRHKVWNDLNAEYLNIKPGDWVRVDDLKDTYPIDEKYMEENYEVVYDES